MRQQEREELRQLYQFRCGYCGVSERDVGAELTVDHFQPRSHNGKHHPENWVYSCHACNEFKGDFWQPDNVLRILHPLREDLRSHLVEREDGTLEALSATGTFHLERLHLNRPQLVAYRQERRRLESARRAEAALFDRLKDLEEQVEAMTSQLEWLERGGPST